MKILGYTIDADLIIGIGPIYKQEPSDLSAQAYGMRRYYFDLYLKNSTVRIETDWFYSAGISEETKAKDRATYNGFKDQHTILEELLEAKFASPNANNETSIRSRHINEVMGLYKETKELLVLTFEEVTPSSEGVNINERMAIVYKNLLRLREPANSSLSIL